MTRPIGPPNLSLRDGDLYAAREETVTLRQVGPFWTDERKVNLLAAFITLIVFGLILMGSA